MKKFFPVPFLLIWTALAHVQVIPPIVPPPPTRVAGEIPQAGEGTINGLVKGLNTENPIGDVQITLTGGPLTTTTGTAGQRRTTTDSNGRFSFGGLPPGRYTIGVQREGYFHRHLPTGSEATLTPSERSGGTVVVGAGRSSITVVYSLIEGGTISGRILDPAGRPAAAAVVWAAYLNYQDGRPLLGSMTQTTTDDRGEYRLYWLEPGDYFVVTEKNLPGGPARSYYPGGDDGRSAMPVPVMEAAESAKIDFSLASSPATLNVSGVVTNLIAGFEISPPMQFYLMPIDDRRIYDGFATFSNVLTSNQDRAEGKFELRNVPVGSYELYAVLQDRSVSPARYFVAHTTLDLGLQDVTGVALRMTPGIDLTGTILSGGQIPAKPVRVQIQPKVPFPNWLGTAVSSTDGTFAIPNVPDSQYRISIEPSEPDSYVAELFQGRNNILDRGIVTVARGLPDTLEVVIKAPASAVRGTVSGPLEQLTAGVIITLVPEKSRRENFALYRRAIASLDGAFSFDGIAPGIYELFAWDRIPDGAEQNNEFMEGHRDDGTEIKVLPGSTSTVKLRLISK